MDEKINEMENLLNKIIIQTREIYDEEKFNTRKQN